MKYSGFLGGPAVLLVLQILMNFPQGKRGPGSVSIRQFGTFLSFGGDMMKSTCDGHMRERTHRIHS